MPSNKTTNYQLSQWDAADRVLRADFNADNAKIDAAIKAVAQQADGLSSAKADKSALEGEASARAAAVSTINTALNKKGNCQIITGSYTGDGKVGAKYPNSLSFSKRPMLVVIGGLNLAILARSSDYGYMLQAGTSEEFTVNWSGTGVSWYIDTIDATAYRQMNVSGQRYSYVAFLEA